MAEQVDNSRTADCRTVLPDRSALDQTPSFAFPELQQQLHPPKDVSGQDSCALTVQKSDLETCSSCGHNGRRGGGGFWGLQQQTGLWTVVMLSCVPLLLSAGSLLCAFRMSNDRNWEMEELRQKVQRLDTLCGVTAQWSSASSPQASVFSDSSATDTSASGPSGFAGKLDVDRLVLLAHRQDSLDQSRKDGLGKGDAYNDDEDDEDDDDDDEEEVNSPYPSYTVQSRQKRSSGRGKRAQNGNGKSKHCKRLDKCIKSKEKGKKVKRKCQRMLQCLPAKAEEKQTFLKAVHFTSDYDVRQDQRQKKFNKDSNPEGLLMTGEETPLHFSQAASWMGKVYKDRAQQPIVPLQDGGFNITQSGLYFLYSSVMFHDVKPRQSYAVVVNGRKLIKCMDSVDYVAKNQTSEEQHKYKTCVVTGVVQLNVNDRLEVQNLYVATEIDQAKDATYFGAILLYPFETKGTP